MRPFLLALAICAAPALFAQTVAIKKVELAGEQVIVHYELEDSNPNNEYQINLYSSKDNYFAPLTKVSGDVGSEVKPGATKKIIWMIRQEYGGYKGKIALEIRGRVYVPFVKLQNFDAKKGFKKGKTYNLTWKPGNSNPINIELYKGGERVSGEINQPNNGAHALFIPKHAVKGSDYRLKFTDTRNTEEVIYTDSFKVGPKVPVWMVAVPVAVVGGVVYLLTSKKSNADAGKLPAAPNPE